MNVTSTFFSSTIGFLVTIGFGFWLSKMGRPYNGILFNVHKLVALGTVILVSIKTYNFLKAGEVQSLVIICFVLAAICGVALFVSGAFLSIGNMNYKVVKTVHTIALLLAAIMMGLAIYLLNIPG